MTSGVARASGAAHELAAAGHDGFSGLRSLASGDDEPTLDSGRFLAALVGAVRSDATPEDRTTRDVYRTAKQRRRRLAAMSFSAGPLIGVASQLADLYGDTATVCDLEAVHHRGLSDDEIAAHMLVLWSVADDFEQALGAVRGDDDHGVAGLIAARLRRYAEPVLPERLTTRGAIKALWRARSLAGDVREAATAAPVRSVLLPGKPTHDYIERAEHQLGLRPPTAAAR
jgi:hypothetical protein